MLFSFSYEWPDNLIYDNDKSPSCTNKLGSYFQLANNVCSLNVTIQVAHCIVFDYIVLFNCRPKDYYWLLLGRILNRYVPAHASVKTNMFSNEITMNINIFNGNRNSLDLVDEFIFQNCFLKTIFVIFSEIKGNKNTFQCFFNFILVII